MQNSGALSSKTTTICKTNVISELFIIKSEMEKNLIESFFKVLVLPILETNNIKISKWRKVHNLLNLS